MSQEQLAQMLTARGIVVNQQTVGKMELGNRRIRFAEAVAIADALGESIDWIAGRSARTTNTGPSAAMVADRMREISRLLSELAFDLEMNNSWT